MTPLSSDVDHEGSYVEHPPPRPPRRHPDGDHLRRRPPARGTGRVPHRRVDGTGSYTSTVALRRSQRAAREWGVHLRPGRWPASGHATTPTPSPRGGVTRHHPRFGPSPHADPRPVRPSASSRDNPATSGRSPSPSTRARRGAHRHRRRGRRRLRALVVGPARHRIDHYDVFRRLIGGTRWPTDPYAAGRQTSAFGSSTGVTTGTAYEYRVPVVDTFGLRSAYSNVVARHAARFVDRHHRADCARTGCVATARAPTSGSPGRLPPTDSGGRRTGADVIAYEVYRDTSLVATVGRPDELHRHPGWSHVAALRVLSEGGRCALNTSAATSRPRPRCRHRADHSPDQVRRPTTPTPPSRSPISITDPDRQ